MVKVKLKKVNKLPKHRVWQKTGNKYILTDNVFSDESTQIEFSMQIENVDGIEVYENDIMQDEKGLYLFMFNNGAYRKMYKSGENEMVSIFSFIPDKIIGNLINKDVL